MKKIIIALLVLLPAVSFASIDVNLNYGSHGSEVIELQEFLIDKGFLTGPATGNFYTLTRRAVVQYQSSVNLPMSGYVGALTREKINSELALGTAGEVKEMGTTTSATITPSTDTTILKHQLELLQQQFAQLTEQQKASSQQTNQTLTQIQQNTAPTQSTTPIPPTVVSVPTSLQINCPNNTNTYPEFVGANCQPVRVEIAVLNQFGIKMDGQSVTMTAPNGYTETTTTVRENTSDNDTYRSYARFYNSYVPQIRTGVETLTFKSGSLMTTSTIHIRDGLTRDKITQDTPNSRWYEVSGGRTVDPVTLMCI